MSFTCITYRSHKGRLHCLAIYGGYIPEYGETEKVNISLDSETAVLHVEKETAADRALLQQAVYVAGGVLL